MKTKDEKTLDLVIQSCKKNFQPWLKIIPQIFSKLDVFPGVVKIIKEIAKEKPSTVIFQVLISSLKFKQEILDSMDPVYVKNIQDLISACLELSCTIKEVCYKDLLQLKLDDENCMASFEKILKNLVGYPESLAKADFMHNYWGLLHSSLNKLNNQDSVGFQENMKHILKLLNKDLSIKTIPISEGSIYLSNLKNSCIPLFDHDVEIVSVSKTFEVLLTKTRPKKLSFLASDGNIYHYLIKGKEDLRLDERISQLLSSLNCTIKTSTRHYPVIPLGNDCGVIKLVDNAVSIYSLYLKWKKSELNGKEVDNPPDVWRDKIQKIVSGPREKWPLDAFVKVFSEMLKETSPDIVRNELFFSSKTPFDWWKRTNDLSVSFATMSIIGYIVGLGDRHLDNILIDFDNSDVIHIDYNICFDRGNTLKIPETVPFRLTRNIQSVINDSFFKNSCYEVYRKMSSVEEMIILLLESFLDDPVKSIKNSGSLITEVKRKLRSFDEKNSIDHLIDQATNVENLARMFEGWTAWI